jgi:Family of unknown function (DUF5675)
MWCQTRGGRYARMDTDTTTVGHISLWSVLPWFSKSFITVLKATRFWQSCERESSIRATVDYLQGKFQIVIRRKHSFAESIIGELYVNGAFLCHTLELAWLWNAKNKSCVPPGEYRAYLRFDHKDKWRIELLNVPGNRQNVQIHIGNYPKDVLGCVLVGTSFAADTVLDSTKAYEKLKAAYRKHPGPISVKFEGILTTPWGDYPGKKSNLA